MMKAAERVPPVIPVAIVCSVGKHHVFVLVIADPISAAFGFRQLPHLAAKTTPWL
jgi:hypothetical protein